MRLKSLTVRFNEANNDREVYIEKLMEKNADMSNLQHFTSLKSTSLLLTS